VLLRRRDRPPGTDGHRAGFARSTTGRLTTTTRSSPSPSGSSSPATGNGLVGTPADVRLTGLDLSPARVDRVRALAARLGRPVDLQQGDAQQLPFPDASFDTVIATLALCSIPDDEAAVLEMARVLRPGGRLVLLDHVASPSPRVRAVQRMLDPLVVRVAADHLLRRPEMAVRAAGLKIEQLSRSRLGVVLRLGCRKPRQEPAPHLRAANPAESATVR
jgi:SAM-dependent methyltransferase